jgi:Na+/melibiose symporter-like transporter
MSPVTRIGKMKPWIAVSVPLTIFMYLLLWYRPNFESQIGLVAWCTVIFSLFYTFVTVS